MVLYGQNRETERKTQDQGATGPTLPLQMDVTLGSGLPSWSPYDRPLLQHTIALRVPTVL